jgi:hypothetical protein
VANKDKPDLTAPSEGAGEYWLDKEARERAAATLRPGSGSPLASTAEPVGHRDESLRGDLNRAYDEEQQKLDAVAGTPPSPQPDPIPSGPEWKFWGYIDSAVLSLFEVLALLFALPFGDALFHDKPITSLYIFYLVIGCFFAIGGPMFPLTRMVTWIPKGIAPSISKAARDARVWIAVLLLFFLYGVAPDIYRRATAPATLTGAIGVMPIGTTSEGASVVTTSLRLQFNAAGDATEIDAKNIKWRAINPEQTDIAENSILFGSCPPGNATFSTGSSLQLGGSNKTICVSKTKTWVIVLSFENSIPFRKIRLNAHGADLPKWENVSMTETSALLWFHGELKNMVLDIIPVN